MSAYGHAIPMPRVRRRKRRKPTSLERLVFGCLCVEVAAGCGGMILDSALGFPFVGALVAMIAAVIVRVTSWPVVWNYIVNGWEDD